MTKKSLIFFLYFWVTLIPVKADEGMWLPLLIGKNTSNMQALGCKLTSEEIYSVNHSSLKDAVVQFGGGCTAEIISPDGLIITNHHCGFSSIQSHSSVQNDFLTNGFWAMSRSEELPNPGLSVRFLVRMEDVTGSVLQGVSPNTPEAERSRIVSEHIKSIESAATAAEPGYLAQVKPFYYGNDYYLLIYEVFNDVRLVGAPPEAIGRFGGDTDNWVWPRHTGDFSLFRIYADKNNKPAPYSPDNVPYKPKKFLKISTKGVNEGDFTMIYGFPGRTQQFITSDAVSLLVNQSNPHKIHLRDIRLSIFNAYMSGNDTIRIQYASKHAGVANAWKKWIGETVGLQRLNAVQWKLEQEQMFTAWANSNPELSREYAGLLPKFKRLYGELAPLSLVADYRNEAVYAVELLGFASRFKDVLAEFSDSTLDTVKVASLKNRLSSYASTFYKNFSSRVDMEVFAAMMYQYHQQIGGDYQPQFLTQVNNQQQDSWMQLAYNIYSKSIFTDSLMVLNLINDMDRSNAQIIASDSIYKIYAQFENIYQSKVDTRYREIQDSIDILYRTYVKGLREMQPDKMFFPDANSTLRVAYGKVAGFSPRDGVNYLYYTTIDGIAQKSLQSDVPDYKPPVKLMELYRNKDFGRYAVNGTVPVAFIATNHTTGGNSGSPVLDSNGNLVGVNFDRCWESTMSDVMFDPNYCRNIALDIRYVLFIIDKFAGAQHLISEMQLDG